VPVPAGTELQIPAGPNSGTPLVTGHHLNKNHDIISNISFFPPPMFYSLVMLSCLSSINPVSQKRYKSSKKIIKIKG